MKEELVHPTKIAVRKSRVKGRGVFATQDLDEGEVVEECHFIISGCSKDMQDKELLRYVFSIFHDKNLSPEENQGLDFRSKLAMFLDDEELQNSFLEEIRELGYEDISQIFSSATVLGFGMIYNHSKHNNIDYSIDYKDFVFRYTTNQKIKKNQELFINYGDEERKDLK